MAIGVRQRWAMRASLCSKGSLKLSLPVTCDVDIASHYITIQIVAFMACLLSEVGAKEQGQLHTGLRLMCRTYFIHQGFHQCKKPHLTVILTIHRAASSFRRTYSTAQKERFGLLGRTTCNQMGL